MSDCCKSEILRLEEQTKFLLDGNITGSISADNVTEFADDLSNSLKTSQQIFPRDISSITNTLDAIIS